jgi:uncharacterized membrane protein
MAVALADCNERLSYLSTLILLFRFSCPAAGGTGVVLVGDAACLGVAVTLTVVATSASALRSAGGSSRAKS